MMLALWTLCHMLICWLCINAQIYYGENTGLKEFPSSEIDNSTKKIYVHINEITAFNDTAFLKFFQLQVLYIGQNPFTELPNLRPVGTTLKKLHCTYCMVTYIDHEMFAALVVLEVAAFASCKLTAFPNIAGPANTLWYIQLNSNQLTSTPCRDKYTALTDLNLANNPINDMYSDPCATHFDDVQLLENLTEVSVASELTTVPLTCPRNNVSISFSGAPVSLCLCGNLWLKALDGQRGSVDMVDKTCEGANTTAEILKQQCQPGCVQMKNIVVREEHFFCSFPIAQYVTGVSFMECGVACLQTLGCSGYNFRQTTRPMFGDCAIVAPTDSSITDIPDQDSPAWTYWAEE